MKTMSMPPLQVPDPVDTTGVFDLPEVVQVFNPGQSLKVQLERYEQALILLALHETAWNQARAADRVRIPLRTLFYKIRSYGLREAGGSDDLLLGPLGACASRDLQDPQRLTFKELVARHEGRLVRDALHHTRGDRARAAELLDVSQRALAGRLHSREDSRSDGVQPPDEQD